MNKLAISIKALLLIIFFTFTASADNVLKGFQIGDDEAPVSVIEYRSLTCSHCAEFANEIFPKIKKHYIDTGKVKFELRPFVLNAIDLNAFKLLHSVDEKDFLQLDKMLFKDQEKWFIIKSTNEESIEQSTEALKRYALLFGLSESEFEDILNDKELEDFILNMRIKAYNEFKINSTPSFIINDKLYSGNRSFSEFEELFNL